MAGYGTEIEAPTWSDGLIKTLLRAAQVRARHLETLEMHYRKRSEKDQITTWDIWVDGSGWMIAAWSQQLERDLPIVAEGYANLPKARSVRIAQSLVARWHDLVVPEDFPRREPYGIRTSASDYLTHVWTLLDWPEPNQLTERLLLSDSLAARWLFFDVPDEVAIEEIHTMCERVLRLITGSGQRVSFPQMIERAVASNQLSRASSDTLREFNNMRREFRHRGREFGCAAERAEARDRIFEAFYVLYLLTPHTGK